MIRKLAVSTIALCSVVTISAKAEEPLGTAFFSQQMPTSGTATIFAASANQQGATIRTIAMWATANAEIALLANYPDGTQRPIFLTIAPPAQSASANLSNPLRLPAGVGLSVTSTFGTSPLGAGNISVTYDLY